MMYSAIEVAQRKEVIDRCYWPLLELSGLGYPLGIEISGLSLEIINDLDPEWVIKFQELIDAKKVELIGSGYSQIIGPIVPHKVNQWNQNLGIRTYEKLLGSRPKIALVNEMAYSSGLVAHYLEAGYEAIIMEWNNPRRCHQEWDSEWRYYHQKAIGSNGKNIKLIWADSIAFQKFQRCVHQESKIDDHIYYLKTHDNNSHRNFPLYSNDVEIFDFRPNRYESESEFSKLNHWKIIIEIYSRLKSSDWANLIFPSELISKTHPNHSENLISLESPDQPIPVKKQEKYNLIRWALTGRGDLEINTYCYRIYHLLSRNKSKDADLWRELCCLWSSDFRTHITQNRWQQYTARLAAFGKMLKVPNPILISETYAPVALPVINSNLRITEGEFYLQVGNGSMSVSLNKRKGLTVKSCIFNNVSSESLFGTLDHGYYDDISLGADYFSGHAVIESLGEHKITDLSMTSPMIFVNDDSDKISIRTDGANGNTFQNILTINDKSITFSKAIYLKQRDKARIHPCIFTLNESAWDPKSLYYACSNGHNVMEKYYLNDINVDHSQSFSLLITAKQGLGTSNGIVEIGDNDKKLIFKHDQSVSALVPYIVFRPVNEGKLLLRLVYSAQEIDETFIAQNKDSFKNIKAQIRITAKSRVAEAN